MKSEVARISLIKQLITCAIFCALAVAVILLFHPRHDFSVLAVGLPLVYQVLVGATFGALYWIATSLGSKYITKRKTAQHIAQSYSRLDLRGWNPLWIALAAGMGEELLFRGALQPLLGIWVTSVLFVLVHTRAYRLNAISKRVLLQSLSIFLISVFFGGVAIYAGLITVMMVHAAMDVVGLYAVRRMAQSPEAAVS